VVGRGLTPRLPVLLGRPGGYGCYLPTAAGAGCLPPRDGLRLGAPEPPDHVTEGSTPDDLEPGGDVAAHPLGQFGPRCPGARVSGFHLARLLFARRVSGGRGRMRAGKNPVGRLIVPHQGVADESEPVLYTKLHKGVGRAKVVARRPFAGMNRRIFVCSFTGYGPTGPYAHRAGHDLNYFATAGVLAMTGPRGGTPGLPGAQIADLAGGALWGATAILGALVGRQRTQQGAHLDISMTEGALAMLAAEIGNLECGVRPSRSTEALNGALAMYAVYRCKDDRYVSVGALEPKFWLALSAALGRPQNVAEIIGDAAQQDATRADVASIFATRTAAEWAAFFADKDCCVEVVLEVDELSSHPLHQAREVFFKLGDVTQVRTPLGTPSRPRPAPRLGEHTAEVLAEYGITK